MEKKIFMALGLHLCTEVQLFHIIVLLGFIKALIMLVVLHKRGYFVEKFDLVILTTGIYWLTYVLFLKEHLTFFSCIFYNFFYLFMIYWAYWYIKYKCKNNVDD